MLSTCFFLFAGGAGDDIAVVPHVCHQNQSRKTNELSREEPSIIESAFSLVFALVLPGRMIRGTPKNTFPGYFSPNPVGRESCHNSGIFPENPGYLAGMITDGFTEEEERLPMLGYYAHVQTSIVRSFNNALNERVRYTCTYCSVPETPLLSDLGLRIQILCEESPNFEAHALRYQDERAPDPTLKNREL